MLRVFRIQRFNPEREPNQWVDEYTLEVNEDDKILDILLKIRDEVDTTLGFRASCAHGVCGSDGMMIDGLNRLACQTFVGDIPGRKPINIAPLKGVPVEKDLIVDMDPLLDKVKSVNPWVVAKEHKAGERELLMSQEDFEKIEDMTKCIWCSCCTTSCPSLWSDSDYLGPQALVMAARFILDTRNEDAEKIIEKIGGLDGVFRCHTIGNCTDACPRDIDVTGAIAAVKKVLLQGIDNEDKFSNIVWEKGDEKEQ